MISIKLPASTGRSKRSDTLLTLKNFAARVEYLSGESIELESPLKSNSCATGEESIFVKSKFETLTKLLLN